MTRKKEIICIVIDHLQHLNNTNIHFPKLDILSYKRPSRVSIAYTESLTL